MEQLLAKPSQKKEVLDYMRKQVRAFSERRLRGFLQESISKNLNVQLAKGNGYTLGAEALRRTVIDYEAFKAKTFVSSGVFPKRYFGYFDERWDTAAHERKMRRTIIDAVQVANKYLEEAKFEIRITEAEIAVTFIAEGGALLLAHERVRKDRIHPIQGVGLDDIAIGFARYPKLIRRLDERLQSGLQNIVTQTLQGPRLSRYMTFQEAILGTLVMWVYEKDLAAKKLWKKERKRLSKLPPKEQFIFSSLVYNSGLVFSTRRMRMIRDFKSASYLALVSKKNAKRRWPLPVFNPVSGRRFLLSQSGYPEQKTSWSAVYHILQRYGGYEALMRFTEVFDQRGAYRVRK